MRWMICTVLGMGLLWGGLAMAQEKPALPAGHPKVGEPALPAGHPKVGDPQLPAGHPVVPNKAGTTGIMELRVVQGTRGGPAIGADPVTIEYYNQQGQVINKTSAKLSDKGELSIKDISLAIPFQPLIIIKHAGVDFRALANPMDVQHAAQRVNLTVYEATEQKPAWSVKMRHVIVTPTPGGLQITEMVSAFNPGDRAWTGEADAVGRMFTMVIPLPAGASNVQMAGALGDKTASVIDGNIVNYQPMVPADTECQISYTVPAKNGTADVSIVAPADTGQFLVFLPDDGTAFKSDSLKKLEPKAGASLRENSRFYTAAPHKAGEKISFTVSGLQALKPLAAEATPK